MKTDSITELNRHVLESVCDYIGIRFTGEICSEMGLAIEEVRASDEWGLNICKVLGDADEFWEPVGGMKFYSRSKYAKAGIPIKFLQFEFPRYSQGRPEFEDRLSVVEEMMFNSPQKINEMLDDYELL